MTLFRAVGVFVFALLCAARAATGQSGIPWSQRPDAAIEQARELNVPVMFWVTRRARWDDDDGRDLRDAQMDSFRDPVVQMIAERFFVPSRVTQNSRVLAIAERIGVDIASENFIAVVTAQGTVLDQIDPVLVASPEALAERLAAASRRHREAVYNAGPRETITNLQADKASVRTAMRTVWRLRIYGADADIAGLLKRTDLTPQERTRVMQMMASMGTSACTAALLDAAPTEPDAGAALARADTGAIPTLLAALPTEEGEVTARQIAAYRALAAVSRHRDVRPDDFWATATAQDRARALAPLRTRAEAVHDAWMEREGRWRWGGK
jgi:hypothetical protein